MGTSYHWSPAFKDQVSLVPCLYGDQVPLILPLSARGPICPLSLSGIGSMEQGTWFNIMGPGPVGPLPLLGPSPIMIPWFIGPNPLLFLDQVPCFHWSPNFLIYPHPLWSPVPPFGYLGLEQVNGLLID